MISPDFSGKWGEGGLCETRFPENITGVKSARSLFVLLLLLSLFPCPSRLISSLFMPFALVLSVKHQFLEISRSLP